MSISLTTICASSNEHAFSNCCFVHPSNFEQIAGVDASAADQGILCVDATAVADQGVLCVINDSCIYYVKPYAGQAPNTIAASLFQRMAGNMSINNAVPVVPYKPSADISLSSVTFEMAPLIKGAEEPTLDTVKVIDYLHRTLDTHILKVGQSITYLFDTVVFKITVKAIDGSSEEATIGGARFGQFVSTTVVDLRRPMLAGICLLQPGPEKTLVEI